MITEPGRGRRTPPPLRDHLPPRDHGDLAGV